MDLRIFRFGKEGGIIEAIQITGIIQGTDEDTISTSHGFNAKVLINLTPSEFKPRTEGNVVTASGNDKLGREVEDLGIVNPLQLEEFPRVEQAKRNSSLEPLSREEQCLIDGLFNQNLEVQASSLGDPMQSELDLMIIDDKVEDQAGGDLQKQYEMLKPIFEQHISDDFENSLWMIKEALRSPFVKDKIQQGLVSTLRGKAIKAKREAMKSAQCIRAIKLKASALGKPLKLGRKTAMGIYPGSAKVCVEMDVSISKPPKIHLRLGTRDLWLPCSYEDHPPFCSKCLRFGHQLSHCQKLSSQAELLGPSRAGGSKQEWKMVMRKVPKPSHDLRRKAPTPEELSSQTETEYEANPTQENRERMQKANAELILATKLEDVLIASQDFFMGQHIPKAYGSTFLTLIPKTENPKRFEDYRPISLSTFMSKINTKILAKRLNTLLPKLISKEQAAFQKGKSIDDHILMAQEAVHLLDKKSVWRNLLKLKVTLDIYLKATGQEINLNKSRFYTSKHITSSQNQHMEKALGIKRGNLSFTYLGAPICKGILRKEHCKDILGHFEKLIHSWYSKTLNQMGRLILIKHVLSSIPLHTLAVHTIPKSIIHTLNRYMANFLWGQKEGSHKYHWVRWAQITKPDVEGGLGIKSLKDLQQAYTLKLWWKARNDIGIWGPYVRARYMKTGIMKERITDSPTWKRICRSNDLATSHTTTTSSGLLWEGGNFSLKSAFNMVQGSGTNILSCKYIWHSSNIPKIKIFLWRLLNSALPFPKNLCRFMAALPSFCPLCHKDNDDIDHSMLHCPTAKEVWNFMASISNGPRVKENTTLRQHLLAW
ncbi:unnamed protein product [Cuscuta campestris]|uniref:Reverse transcriptase zinc-binding domain-containing protein n=1 Tax=Cuscuta campestris TaxID=132261 RepID=A0A484KUQ9_9ASTE|nr:unnamed protein product [Cuscuta campestris]